MGGCCSKVAVVAPDDGDSAIAGKSLAVSTELSPKGGGPASPNLFRVLSLGGLSADGDARAGNQGEGVGGAGGHGGGANGASAASAGGKAGQGQGAGGDFEEVGSASAVKVAVLVRPLMQMEKDKQARDIVQVMPPGKIKLPSKPTGSATDNGYSYDFDRVYKVDNPAASKQVFGQLALPVVERFCQGFHATILAYGQTGSGKTYTMGTSASMREAMAGEPQGIIPRIIHVLFNYTQLASAKYDVNLSVTYIEIYNEQIQDLLRGTGAGASVSASAASTISAASPAKLEIRESPNGGGVYVDGAVEVKVNSKENFAHLLDMGNANRATAAHKMNAESSRSHAIVTITLEQRAKLALAKTVPQELRYLRSKLHLVDLAGSERVKETGATGARFAEGVNINKGLLELGNVINALTEGNRRHVPYRNSKLTRVLQDSLGGNSETLFLACISPADSNHDHSLNTLRYASRARSIRNTLRLNNTLTLEEEVEYLRVLCANLQAENADLKTRLAAAGGK